MRVAIIDYGSGNLRSASKAFERAAREGGSGAEIELTDDADRVRNADRIVLPGVGAYADCRRGLDAVPGMIEALEERVVQGGAPFLGICVGMQLMASRGLEKTVTLGLGWIAGDVKIMEPADTALKIPQIGWNTIHVKHSHPLLAGIETGENGLHAYFVHSYYLDAKRDADVAAVTDYGGPVTAIVARDNMAGTQFHPEKSQALGLALIANFLSGKKGYWIAIVSITDPDNYPAYIAANKAAFDKYGAKFLVRGGASTSPEGFAGDRHVIVEFDTYETALACYNSPEYQEALKLRRAYSTAHFAILEGFA